jgi:flagellar biosynthesis/type III secretory pathway M-ring protein FliF/YscJ
VESLPFESSLNAQPPASAPKPKPAPADPAWVEFLRRYRDLLLPVTLGVALLVFLLRAAIKLLTPRKVEKPKEVQLPAQLPPAGNQTLSPQLAVEPVTRAVAQARQDESLEVAARVRQLAQSDLPLAANVLRLWLQESESRS